MNIKSIKGFKVNWEELSGAIGGTLAIGGVVLNADLNKKCFILWIVSNSIFAVLHWRKKMYTTVIRDVVFLGLAFFGIWTWAQKGI